jgi:[ribosomal protein S18]-alanine N-acetyltransferase
MTAPVRSRLRIRPMVPPDMREVLAIEDGSFRSPWTEEMFLGELARGEVTRALVLEEREPEEGPEVWALRGFVLAWLVEDELHINNVAVSPLHRNRGLARALLERLLADSREDGAHWATLEVRAGNLAAIALYTGFGFGLEGRRKAYYDDGEDALILTRELGGAGEATAGQGGEQLTSGVRAEDDQGQRKRPRFR